jgi:hypothetical protein
MEENQEEKLRKNLSKKSLLFHLGADLPMQIS